jgi:hypothetical protein
MIYTIILKPRFRNITKALICILVVSFSASLYSCQTVHTEKYTPEQLRTAEDVKYLEAKTTNDSTINLSDYDVMYKDKYKDSSDFLVYEKTDTIFIKNLIPREYKLNKSLTEINLKGIINIKGEKREIDWIATTIFSLLGITLITAAIISFPWKWNGSEK